MEREERREKRAAINSASSVRVDEGALFAFQRLCYPNARARRGVSARASATRTPNRGRPSAPRMSWRRKRSPGWRPAVRAQSSDPSVSWSSPRPLTPTGNPSTPQTAQLASHPPPGDRAPHTPDTTRPSPPKVIQTRTSDRAKVWMDICATHVPRCRRAPRRRGCRFRRRIPPLSACHPPWHRAGQRQRRRNRPRHSQRGPTVRRRRSRRRPRSSCVPRSCTTRRSRALRALGERPVPAKCQPVRYSNVPPRDNKAPPQKHLIIS